MKPRHIVGIVAGLNLTTVLLAYTCSSMVAFSWNFGGVVMQLLVLVLSCPVGLIGMVGSKLVAGKALALFCLYGGFVANALLWGFVAGRLAVAIAAAREYHAGFDATAIIPRIEHLRHDHAVAAHQRAHPSHSRRWLLITAGRVVSRFAYFTDRPAEQTGWGKGSLKPR